MAYVILRIYYQLEQIEISIKFFVIRATNLRILMEPTCTSDNKCENSYEVHLLEQVLNNPPPIWIGEPHNDSTFAVWISSYPNNKLLKIWTQLEQAIVWKLG